MDACIRMNEHALGGQTLGTVAGDSIAIIEVAILRGIEFDLAIIVESCYEAAVGMDGFNDCKVAIGNAKRLVRRGKLNAIANGKLVAKLRGRR